MRTFPLMPEEGDGGSKTGGHLVGKKPFTSGSIVNIKIQEMKQYVYVIASTEHTM